MKDFFYGLFKLISMCVIVIVLTLIVNLYILQLVIVTGESMEPNFNNGDLLVVNKVKQLQDIDRYDIIVLKTNDKFHQYIIKRVYGLPGETIQIKNSKIYVNGKEINDPYCKEKQFKPGIADKVIQLKNDEYFILGDNRNASADSRYENIGVVKGKDFMGEAFIGILPFKLDLKDFKE